MLLNRKNKKRRRQEYCLPERLNGVAAFVIGYRDVLGACMLLHAADGITPGQMAARYMTSVLQKHKDASWWQANAEYLTQPWFIYEYACDNGLIKRAECRAEALPERFVIDPEESRQAGCVRIHIERMVGNPVSGSISMSYEQADKTYHWLARMHHFQLSHGVYTRTTGEADGSICDRAVETALALLRQGYRVCVEESLIREKILAEDFEPAYPYWVMESAVIDKLELRYPRDERLHGYVYRAGGRWNGRTMEISICNAHLLDDLIRLYGFRITKGAQRRMDAWRTMLDQATVYRPRKRKKQQDEQPMVDRFRELMKHRAEMIDDLVDRDE